MISGGFGLMRGGGSGGNRTPFEMLPIPIRQKLSPLVAMERDGRCLRRHSNVRCLGPQDCGALKVFTVPLAPQSWGLLSPKRRPGKFG